jgi:ubiquinone/menaquinone biosynthesis C-methylase UbiE
VLEVGCGTGRIAARLLRDELPSDAEYVAIDVSQTMVRLSRDRLADWPRRARVLQVPGGHEALPVTDGSMDRVLTTYVMDLMTAEDRAWTLEECHRVLGTGGLLCHAGLAPGEGPLTSAVSAIWRALHQVSPWLVGGCRPLVLSRELVATQWKVRCAERVARFGVTSEVVVAEAI